MKYRQLGRSGLRVPVISIGSLPFGGHQRPEFGHVDVETARRIVDIGLDSGANLIDSADVYGFGNSERTVGAVISGRRDRVLLATKCRAVISEDPNAGGLSRKHIMMSVEHSLRRLGTDYIDIYQAHGWDGSTAIDEVVGAFDQLVRDGKVRYVGCSNYSAWHVMKSLAAADLRSRERFVSQQIHYTLISREAEHELVPLALDQGVGIMVWGPLAGGLLSGEFERGTHDSVVSAWREPPVPDPARVFEILDVVRQVARERNATPAQVALAYILAQPGVSTVITGPRHPDHMMAAVAAAELELTGDELDRLDAVSRIPLPYPYWHQRWSAIDRLSAADASLHTPRRRE